MVLPVIYELISSLVPPAGKSLLCIIFYVLLLYLRKFKRYRFGARTTCGNMDEPPKAPCSAKEARRTKLSVRGGGVLRGRVI